MGRPPVEFFQADEKGKISFVDLGFSSTSEDLDNIERFHQEIIEQSQTPFIINVEIIQLKNEITGCHQGINLDWINFTPGENEILFPPLTVFEVISKRRDGFNLYLQVVPFYSLE